MRLLSLEVANYRNIAAAQLEPGRELTVICGNNGQGKTNLLEAIWLLTGGKSSVSYTHLTLPTTSRG